MHCGGQLSTQHCSPPHGVRALKRFAAPVTELAAWSLPTGERELELYPVAAAEHMIIVPPPHGARELKVFNGVLTQPKLCRTPRGVRELKRWYRGPTEFGVRELKLLVGVEHVIDGLTSYPSRGA